MPVWYRVASVAELPVGGAMECLAGDRIVAIFNVGGAIHALDGVCPHQGGPLGKGTLAGAIVTCPWHGWQFNVKTGQHCLNPRIEHRTFPVQVRGDEVFVDVE